MISIKLASIKPRFDVTRNVSVTVVSLDFVDERIGIGIQQYTTLPLNLTCHTVTYISVAYLNVGKYSKCHNSPTNGPTVTKLGCSHSITFPTCPQWCGCHGNGRCLPTAHWTFCSYRRLEAERVNCEPISMKFGTQQHVGTTMTVPWTNIKC